MKKLLNISRLLTLLVLILFFSCKGKKDGDKKDETTVTFSEEHAKEISFVSNGDVHFDEIIQVVFNNPVIEENEVNSSPQAAAKKTAAKKVAAKKAEDKKPAAKKAAKKKVVKKEEE